MLSKKCRNFFNDLLMAYYAITEWLYVITEWLYVITEWLYVITEWLYVITSDWRNVAKHVVNE